MVRTHLMRPLQSKELDYGKFYFRFQFTVNLSKCKCFFITNLPKFLPLKLRESEKCSYLLQQTGTIFEAMILLHFAYREQLSPKAI